MHVCFRTTAICSKRFVHRLHLHSIVYCFNKILFLQGIPFNVTVGGPTNIDVYHETGKILSFSNCTGGLCNATLEPACVLSVKATPTDDRGFILYSNRTKA